ncbi:Predicted dehydrogenase [Modicisalibacter ilicicola DSM 19980]|uniref:Predicted dehydrogenase n=1 Tax=Modicisalibacter ilicicola DSM 19980 TaxID=1121942 RepID=A0A1M5ENP9_9GAMM|nr:Gfo/Idh/MocA family oxidoreductase [Halomonas ilicicola]SHF80847.1 Predicted dehydrogenase [Halomonas ilicicola DSM 19980]
MSVKRERALIIGYGSIGKRHARLLNDMKLEVALLTQQKTSDFLCYRSLSEAMNVYFPTYIVVANETWRHAQTVRELPGYGFDGKLLVEKPLFSEYEKWPQEAFAFSGVAYNLRFHPFIQRIRRYLETETSVAVSVRCGQHLSEWRPGTKIENSYSASSEAGGGVLRDLSHELDYLLWLFGPWSRVTAIGGNYDVLGIDADECWSILMEMQSGVSATINISYLDRPAQREIAITTRTGTLKADLVNATLFIDGKKETHPTQRDQTYLAMHHAMLGGESSDICSAKEGLAVVNLIQSIEKASESRNWVSA